MNELRFPASAVVELLDHTEAATEHRGIYGDTPTPALLWAKDEGTYLLSSGLPEMPAPGNPARQNVVYAEGLGPDADWSLVQEVCGGDDFVEALRLDDCADVFAGLRAAAATDPSAMLVIELLDDDAMNLSVETAA